MNPFFFALALSPNGSTTVEMIEKHIWHVTHYGVLLKHLIQAYKHALTYKHCSLRTFGLILIQLISNSASDTKTHLNKWMPIVRSNLTLESTLNTNNILFYIMLYSFFELLSRGRWKAITVMTNRKFFVWTIFSITNIKLQIHSIRNIKYNVAVRDIHSNVVFMMIHFSVLRTLDLSAPI